MDQGKRCQIRKWGALIQNVGQNEGVWVYWTGSHAVRVNVIVRLGIQLYTTISYASFGSMRFTG